METGIQNVDGKVEREKWVEERKRTRKTKGRKKNEKRDRRGDDD